MTKMPLHLLLLLIILLSTTTSSANNHHRHLLHQPLFPLFTAPPPSQPPLVSTQPASPSPQPHRHQQQQEKHPFSSFTSPTTPTQHNPFFPSSSSSTSSPPPPPSPASLATFPANISSLLFPSPKSQHDNRRHVSKLIITLTFSVVSVAIILSLLSFFLLRHHRRPSTAAADDTKSSRSDSLRLFNTAPSDASHHKLPPKYTSTNTSSEFLYLGTLVNSKSGGLDHQNASVLANAAAVAPTGVVASSSSSSSQYQKLGSPELRPLPPLPKYNVYSGEQMKREEVKDDDDDDGDDDEFFSPKGSSGGRKQSPTRVWSSSRREFGGIAVDPFGSTSFNSRTASYPYSNSCSATTDSVSSSPDTNISPRSLKSNKSHASAVSTQELPESPSPAPVKLPPPPPPLPPQRFWEVPVQVIAAKERVDLDVDSGNGEEEMKKEKEEISKPKLKALHWDKVRANSSRGTVWDQIKCSSFQLNEEMIETLFRVNDPNSKTKDSGGRQGIQSVSQENRALDPKKSQNIAILLRALNVTVDEVCEALSEGNLDLLGPELLECLLKMAPSKEEEQKLKEFKDESKLGPAEKFLKALLDIPVAFKRVEAMLYVVNFDSEIEFLRRSFETLEAACGELKNTRMFLKLLEAVLKTGNRMNVGTNRGDAHAFKLDTLLKLVDIKGTDGKTTLLHFVVQEISKSEGSCLSEANQSEKTNQSSFQDDVDLRKLGLQVVSSLSGELSNVKKAAAMDSEMLNNEITKMATGITKVKEVAELNEEIGLNDSNKRFLQSMNAFLNKAQEEITSIQARGNSTFSMVKEVTEYFHGNSAKEEGHPFRIFMVVRDFLSILDQACKEVGKINERTVYSSVRPTPVNPNLPLPFPSLNARQNSGFSDDESSTLS